MTLRAGREAESSAPAGDKLDPPSCPSCKSTLTVATAKVPSATGYWRCESCGEVWSPARRMAQSPGRWRA